MSVAPAVEPETPGSPEAPRLFYGWWIAVAAFVGVFISAGTVTYTTGAFLTPMSDDLGWTNAEFLYAQTVAQIVMGIAGFFVGSHIDRHGSRPLMLIGAVIMGASLCGIALVQDLWQWILLKGIIATVGGALVGNLVVNVTLSKWFVEQRGRAVGWASIGVSMSGIALPPLVTWFIDGWGWRATWVAFGIFAFAVTIPAALIMRRQPEDYGLNPDGKSDEEMSEGGGAAAIADYANSFTRGEALHTSSLYLLMFAFGFALFGLITIIIIIIPYLTDSGFERGTAAFMLTLFAVAAAVSKPIWGWMGDNWADRASAAASFLTNTTGMIVLILGVNAGSTIIVGTGTFLVGWGVGGQIPLQEMIWASYFGRRYLGQVRGVSLPVAMLMGASGPMLVALYYDQTGHYGPAMYSVAGLWALAAVLVLIARRPSLADHRRASVSD